MHLRVVALFVELAALAPPVCHAVLLAALSHASLPRRVDAFRRFSLLWRVAGELHASAALVPPAALHALLDALHAGAHDETLLRLTARTWLAEALTTHVARLLDPLLDALLDARTLREAPPGLAYQGVFATLPVRAELRRLALLGEVAATSFAHAVLATPLSPEIVNKARAYGLQRSGGAGGGDGAAQSASSADAPVHAPLSSSLTSCNPPLYSAQE